MIRFISIFVVLLCVPISVIAQETSNYEDDDDEEVTRLDRKGMAKVIASVKPAIDDTQAKIVEEWKKSDPEVKIKECALRRKNCVKNALKGGHRNPVMEAARIYFCKKSREICGDYWK